ncbi:MAG: amidophosphoribosyltransferase [Nitrospina sp.]|jgi:amidophosphoribosyltransferase|nr:amidophosphoribosyltransferase [Nitrospina sp.]MBT3876115.1 amidophosphoribosyltransferase [Nitrospina sp.]MBT4048872.1 amidophosphoribosyltransferase [Nitrospina sp.]MBT4557581.1 amidophosphoribosyltransferase [Nitrospina sp.]MBT5349485.1 amidophosphoribosyltransferase [Nitrospina sp.]
MLDKLHEECGVVGVYGHPEAANLVYLGLYALQHRGQESAGIVASTHSKMHLELGMGLVADIFDPARILKLPGPLAIGHNRYSTAGKSELVNAQPCMINYSAGSLALAHNGNLVNAQTIRKELGTKGAIFQSTNDSEVIVHLMAQSKAESFVDRAAEALRQVSGAYSLVLMTETELLAARDPHGFRPLCLGKLDGAYIVASETCVMDLIEAEFIREVEPGELILVNSDGIQSFFPFKKTESKHCVFEHIYFARPDSYMFGEHVYTARKEMGKAMAQESPADVDLIVPVPDSGVVSAMGFSEEMGIPFEMGLIRNHYVGRTFIEPQSQIRHFGVKLKLNAVKSIISGKRIAIIDDSIVRGTTSRKIVKMLRDAGAKEVHLRISAPPILHSCFYGIDTPNKEELIAHKLNLEETCKYLAADSLAYLSLEKMMTVLENGEKKFCSACFDGNYPVPIIDKKLDTNQLGLFTDDNFK